MSIREVTMYQIECDAPGCTVNTKDSDEYWAWVDQGQAEDDWENGDGIITDDRKHWCLKHWAWCSVCESEQIPSHPDAAKDCASCTVARAES